MSRTKKIALLDYGMGNLHSASKALAAVGAEVSITNDPKVVAAADKIFFPGVGAMRDCIAGMHEAGIDEVIRQAVFNKPVMAICVGMQALFEQSAENGGTTCLGILDGSVEAFDPLGKMSRGLPLRCRTWAGIPSAAWILLIRCGMASKTMRIFTLYIAITARLATMHKWRPFVITVSRFVPVFCKIIYLRPSSIQKKATPRVCSY